MSFLSKNRFEKVFIDKYFSHTMTGEALKIPRYIDLASVGDEPGMEGDIILDRTTKEFCYHDGQTWHCILVGGEDVTLRNLCSGANNFSLVGGNGIVEQGPALRIKGLTQGSGILLSNTANCVTISTNVTLQNACPLQASGNLVANGSGPNLAIKGLVQGSGIVIANLGSNCVEISASIPPVSLTNACQSTIPGNLVANGSGPNLSIKGLVAGEGISLNVIAPNCIQISASSTVILENACPSPDANLVVDGTGPSLKIKGLLQGTGINLIDGANCVLISSTSSLTNVCSTQVNTANLVSGAGPLSIKGLTGGTGITIVDSPFASCAVISLDETCQNFSSNLTNLFVPLNPPDPVNTGPNAVLTIKFCKLNKTVTMTTFAVSNVVAFSSSITLLADLIPVQFRPLSGSVSVAGIAEGVRDTAISSDRFLIEFRVFETGTFAIAPVSFLAVPALVIPGTFEAGTLLNSPRYYISGMTLSYFTD